MTTSSSKAEFCVAANRRRVGQLGYAMETRSCTKNGTFQSLRGCVRSQQELKGQADKLSREADALLAEADALESPHQQKRNQSH